MNQDTSAAVPATTAIARHWRRVALVWMLAACAWTPAVHLTGSPAGAGIAGILGSLAQTLVHFLPWAIATPLFLWLSRRFPIGLGQTGRHVLLFTALGLILTPAFTLVGVTLARLIATILAGSPLSGALSNFGLAVLITSLFAVPTYTASVAIGQTIAYFERYRAREAMLSHARAEALRAQIAPHFLFNALNAISALGYREPERADEAMVRLAALLRTTLDRPDRVLLRDEIAMAADYIELHRLLLGDRLEVTIDVAPDAWEMELPSLLLQPLVENAIVHGPSRLTEGGAIHLRAFRQAQALCVEISNDAPSSPGPDAGHKGLGLDNVRRRIQALFGSHATLVFRRDSDQARVTMTLPARAEGT